MSNNKQVRTSARSGIQNTILGTRNLMTAAALAVVGSLVVAPVTYFAMGTAATPASFFTFAPMMGLYLLPYLLPGAVVKRPGAVLLSGLIIGIVTTFTTPIGGGAIISNLLGAAFLEVPLAIMLYRRWGLLQYLIAGTVFGVLNGLLYVTQLMSALSVPVKITGFALGLIGSWIGVLLAYWIANALNKAGVGQN